MTEQQCPKCGRATIQMTPDGRRRCSARPNQCAWTGQGAVGPTGTSAADKVQGARIDRETALMTLKHELHSEAITPGEFVRLVAELPAEHYGPAIALLAPRKLEHITTVVRFDGQAVPLTCGAEDMRGSCHLERGHDGPHKCRDNATVGGVWKWYGNPIQKCQSTWRGKPCALVNGHPGSHPTS